MKKVSVIVPVYNTKKYLKQCINSILKQSLKDIEIVCIDDGSTDGSSRILDRFALKDKRVRVIHKKNTGYGDTLNTGIKVSKGKYIGIIDSDDYTSSDMYKTLYDTAEKNRLDFVKSDFYEIRNSRNAIKRKRVKGFGNKEIYNKVLDPHSCKFLFNYVTMNVWTGLYRRDFIIDNNIRFNETPGAAFQDNGFWFQTLSLSHRIMFIDSAYYHYRKDNPNSSINNKHKVYDIITEYGYIKRFLQAHKNEYDHFFAVYVIQKYYAYSDAYRRIGNKYKIGFLKKCSKEYKNDLEELGDQKSLSDRYVLGEMLRIIDSPEIYFYESMVDTFKAEFEEVSKDLAELKKFSM